MAQAAIPTVRLAGRRPLEIGATGRKIAITGILVAHFAGGLIYEAFSAFDSGEMMRQLGAH